MNRSLKWIAAALGIVLMVALTARSLGEESFFPENWQVSLLMAEEGPSSLTITDHEAVNLRIGNSVEIHRFTLDMETPYTLRYLTFDLEMTDLWAEDWFVYEVHKGDIDYQNKVAQGESYENGQLKLRFFSERSHGYYGEGEQEFALVSTLNRSGENPEIKVSKTQLIDWIEGHLNEAWGAF